LRAQPAQLPSAAQASAASTTTRIVAQDRRTRLPLTATDLKVQMVKMLRKLGIIMDLKSGKILSDEEVKAAANEEPNSNSTETVVSMPGRTPYFPRRDRYDQHPLRSGRSRYG